MVRPYYLVIQRDANLGFGVKHIAVVVPIRGKLNLNKAVISDNVGGPRK